MRLTHLRYIFLFVALACIAKLLLVQVFHHEKYLIEAENQHTARYKIPAERGEIVSADNYLLVSNKKAFLVYLSLNEFRKKVVDTGEMIKTAEKIAPLLWEYDRSIAVRPPPEKKPEELSPEEATLSAEVRQLKQKEKEIKSIVDDIAVKMANKNVVWVPLKKKVDESFKDKLTQLRVPGLGFQELVVRSYPEATLSATTVGFVGQDSADNSRGYLGLEGFYDGELKGRDGFLRQEVDAEGRPILVGKNLNSPVLAGSTLYTNIDRTVQYIAEKKLDEGIRKFGAAGGSVLIMDPATGAVVASASRPSFVPEFWNQYKQDELVDPAIGITYEPGSTFKLITYSAGIEEGVISPETTCPCNGPLTLNGFTIRTWNNKYLNNPTMAEGLQNSDNIVTSFIANKLGNDRLYKFIKRFGFGELTEVDLEGEEKGIISDPKGWIEIDLATHSFGQGITVTPLQMIRAVAAIANDGKLMRPYIVQKVTRKKDNETDESVRKPIVVRQVIKPNTAKQMTEMMVRAVESGESKNFLPKGMRVAGKTGTAQIPVEGRYDPHNYTASFVGFAPVEKPKFVMLVKYDKPKSSIYGSTTAAPTFFDIAKELYAYWGIPYE